MLIKWNVEGFKSIYKREEFSLAPLTLFTGANSSGKSTVIQSILTTAQTFQNPLKNNKVLLNGPLIRLGSYEDVHSYGLEKETSIGFAVNLDGRYNEALVEFHRDDPYSHSYTLNQNEYYEPNDFDEEKPLEMNFAFYSNLDEVETNYYPRVSKFTIRDYNQYWDESYLETVIEYSPEKIQLKKKRNHIKYSDTDIDPILGYDVSSHEVTIGGERFRQDSEIKGAIPEGFLDMEYFKTENLNHVIAEIILDYYTQHPETQIKLLNKFIIKEETRKIYKAILKIFINECYKAELLSIDDFNIDRINQSLEQAEDLTQLVSAIDLINNVIHNGHSGLLLRDSIGSRFKEHLLHIVDHNLKPTTRLVPTGNPYSNYIHLFNEYFQERVKYLGPLREEPKPIYNNPGSINIADVGIKGEFTSFVLELNKNTIIEYISPEDLNTDSYIVKEGTLIEAVIEWIKYLEVGYDIQTIDEGSIGRRLKIQLEEKGRFVDLTNVGVGVSQVLPILVSSLLAEKYSTLIFEQPELHLHPKIQTKLADFFLTNIELEKQCIIETHSEHIINRLRYIAITSPKDQVPERTLIYFVEKEEGRSNYRQIRMNEYGNIGKWPKGFFDESEKMAISIIRAIQAKRRGE